MILIHSHITPRCNVYMVYSAYGSYHLNCVILKPSEVKDPRKKRMRNHEFLHGRIQKIPLGNGVGMGALVVL